MDITPYVQRRYTTKKFDPDFTLDPAQVEQLVTLLHQAPSSVNSQPWHFLIVESTAAKGRLAKAAEGPYQANNAKFKEAALSVVLCLRTGAADAHIERVVAQEQVDGRLANAEVQAATLKGRFFYLDLHRYNHKDLPHWQAHQLYIALGFLLLGASAMGLDACPIEGFDPEVLDREFDLRAQGYTSVVCAAIGRRAADDFNAKLPKSRLPLAEVVTRL